MKTRRRYRLSPSVIAADRALLKALKDLPGYVPINPAFTIEALEAREARLAQSEGQLRRDEVATDLSRASVIQDAWDLHDDLLGVKASVIAQFGRDSNEVHALGLKRPSDYKRPVRPRKSTPTTS